MAALRPCPHAASDLMCGPVRIPRWDAPRPSRDTGTVVTTQRVRRGPVEVAGEW